MKRTPAFETRLAESLSRLSPTERRVGEFFAANREEVLVASAERLAEMIGTSDASVVRAARALGYSGLDALRRALANELRAGLTPAVRLSRTLDETGNDLHAAFQAAIETQREALDTLSRTITPGDFAAAVSLLAAAPRVAVFGIGPSGAIAEYFTFQLQRFGREAFALMRTGLLAADDLNRLRKGDALLVLAYGRVYREVDTLLERSAELDLASLLVSDTLGGALGDRVSMLLPVARGRADTFSMHTATLGLLEALLVGIAVRRRSDTLGHLTSLNRLRAALVGKPMDLQLPEAEGGGRPRARAKR
jgi:DNA-binding MurR/RpiR family transcriptional regulator